MTPKGHALLSPIPGGIYFAMTGDWMFSGLAIAASIFIDIDHVFDRLIEERHLTSLFDMVKSYQSDQIGKVYLLFHSIEFQLAAFFFFEPIGPIRAVIIGCLFHIFCDVYQWVWKERKASPFTYLIIYRMYHSFDFQKLLTPEARSQLAK